MSHASRVVAVAVSGGRDSTALLHATTRAAKALGVQVVALHVHHGLNPAADQWQAQVERQCARWARDGWPVSARCTRLQGSPSPGESVEAWARRERYAALAHMAQQAGAPLVLLAHHRRDQAETFLLQALRGAGPAGLSSMPREAVRGGLRWIRPWLDQPASAIAAYVARYRLSHIEDDSNHDTRFDRNRLRHDVWPALLAAFAHAESALVQAAHLAQQAQALVDEVAAADVAALRCAEGLLSVAGWLDLSAARRAASLRHWLRQQVDEGVPETLVTRLLIQLPGAKAARWPLDGQRELRLYRGRLECAQRAMLSPTWSPGAAATAQETAPFPLHRPGRWPVPAWGGTLTLSGVDSGGVPVALLERAMLRERQPGDQFQMAPRSLPRSLKKQFQAAAVPAWARGGPLIATADQVVYVPGLGIDARAWAAPGEPQLSIHWASDEPPPSAEKGTLPKER
ncbi:tRNA lysidine(34) synthetase TilS [Ideonella sp. DXS29W]|uniref:tRNA(Ile)-lysidine synthase n=1 Tax=Ideonella lacteola TaxID=2984193 RepID=A0ABU9BSA9_9BURK